ncbi:MAG: phosphofructokinase [Thermoleophilia bacterium]|nr:phosphofructokinase [Thermoleophilia bacterium]
MCVFAPVTLLTVTIESGPDDEEEVHIHPGGQGVWVARMVRGLGGRPVLCTPVGGETGAVLEHLLAVEGIEARPVPVDRQTAALIQDRRGGDREDVWMGRSPTLGRHALDDLYSHVLAEALAAGVCVIAGTHLQEHVIPDDLYTRLAGDLRSAGVRVIVDLSDDPLRAVLAAGVHIVKVSDEELVAGGWAASDALPDLVEGVERLLAAGAGHVVVSRAAEGSLAATGDGRWLVEPPRLDAVDTRGAGDSMTAALALATAEGSGWKEMLRVSAAAGTVNVTRHGSGSGRREAVLQLAERTTVTALREAPR